MFFYLHQSETGEWGLFRHLDDASASSRETNVNTFHQLLLSIPSILKNQTHAGAIFLVIIAEGNCFRPSISTPLAIPPSSRTHIPRRNDPNNPDRLLNCDIPQPRNSTRDRIPVVTHSFG
jgi:hypothetical protein